MIDSMFDNSDVISENEFDSKLDALHDKILEALRDGSRPPKYGTSFGLWMRGALTTEELQLLDRMSFERGAEALNQWLIDALVASGLYKYCGEGLVERACDDCRL